MDFKKIDILLNKYFEGRSSLEEETFLKEYFSSENVALEHLPYKQMFDFFKQARQEKNPTPVRLMHHKQKRRRFFAMAAAVIIGLGLVVLMQDNQNSIFLNQESTAQLQFSEHKQEDKEEVIKEMKKFSYNLNKGVEKTGVISIFGKTTQKVFKLKNEKK